MSTTMKTKSKRVKAKARAGKANVETGNAEGRVKKSKAKKITMSGARRTEAADAKPKRVSALDAAAQVLAKAGKPMRAQELITAMAEQGLWKSPGGATPHSTLYAAMQREERVKSGASRFRKVDRGLFELAGKRG